MKSNWHVWFLLLVFYCASPINCYINVRLEDKLCPLGAITSPPPLAELTLLEDSESAAIFTQQWNGTSTAPCEFTVYSNSDIYRIPKGTYITITDINFRKNPETNECLDYIQFVDGGTSVPSERICEPSIVKDIRKLLILDYHNRNVRVIIHIDDSTAITEPLELRMVMTAHSQCKHKNDLLCDPKVPYSCISRHFVNDNITNCIPPCLDETSCWPEVSVNSFLKAEPKFLDSVSHRSTDNEPNCITVGILEEKLKENRELLSAVLRKSETRLFMQIDDLTKDKNNGGADVNAMTCLTKEYFKEKLQEHSQLILNAVEAPEERFKRMELYLFTFQQELFKLREKLDQLQTDSESPPRRVN